jgi:acyl-CoA synthetase (AMP-forming)/AMP-acid ligase II
MNAYLNGLCRNFETPERLFATMVSKNRETAIRWGDLDSMARSFLAAYRAASVTQGAVILIFLRHTPALYGSFFGAMLGGFVPSFMPCTSPRQDPALYWASHRAVLDRIAPGLVVADRQTLVEMAANGLGGYPTLSIEEVGSGTAAWSVPAGNSIGLLQHSSGTTGLKKGVALSYDALAAQSAAYATTLGLGSKDVIASWLPLYHDMGLIACLIMPSLAGCPFVHLDPFDWIARPGRLFDAIERHKATMCWLPNFAFDHLAATVGRRGEHYELRSVRAFINCSEPCKTSSFDKFARAFGVPADKLQCCYAMAETVFAVTQTCLGRAPARIRVRKETLERGCRVALDNEGVELIETGSPLPGVKLRILGERQEALPEGYFGQVSVSCPFLFAGYHAEPEKTAKRLIGREYYTGDLGFLHEGRLYVLGRFDDVIIVSGRNVYGHEIEAIVSGIEGVKPGRSVAVPQFDERSGTQGLVVIAERTGAHPDTDVARRISETILSLVNVMPHAVHLVEEGWLVKTTSGKIMREANLRRFFAPEEFR